MTVKELLDRLPEGGHVVLVRYTEDTQGPAIGEYHALVDEARAAAIVLDDGTVVLAKDNYGTLAEVAQ